MDIDKSLLPKHIGIIMDGNGRWAKKRGLPRSAGHVQGAKTFKVCVQEIIDIGIDFATFYAFSTENWKRPKDEIDNLMKLFEKNLDELYKMDSKNIRLRFIGDFEPFSESLSDKMLDIMKKTDKNTGLTCTLAVNYGGRSEIITTIKRIITEGVLPKDIDEAMFSDYLFTAGYPDVDLIIRPSGEKRLSNFLIWQSAYAEFLEMDVLWPDFSKEELLKALTEFTKRNRRFGGI